MDKRPDYKTFKAKALKNEKVKAEYEVLRPQFELVIAFIKACTKAKISQAENTDPINIVKKIDHKCEHTILHQGDSAPRAEIQS